MIKSTVGCCLCVLLLSACGQATTDASTGHSAVLSGAAASAGPSLLAKQGNTPVWKPSPAGAGETVYPGFGVRTKDVPAGKQAGISGDQAQKIAQGTDFYDRGLLPGTPSVQMQTYSNTDVPPGQVVAAPVGNRLVWMVTYQKSPAAVRGGITSSDVSGPASISCTFVLAVDANSGTILDNFQDCHT